MKRFWDKVDKTDTCWNWTAANTGRYGVFWFKGRNVSSHRFSYQLIKGDIPKDLVIDHLCNNTLCVNPDHLKATTQQDNVLRNPLNNATINANKTHCNKGHEFNKENTYLHKGLRHCKECRRERCRLWRKRKGKVS